MCRVRVFAYALGGLKIAQDKFQGVKDMYVLQKCFSRTSPNAAVVGAMRKQQPVPEEDSSQQETKTSWAGASCGRASGAAEGTAAVSKGQHKPPPTASRPSAAEKIVTQMVNTTHMRATEAVAS